MSSILTQDSLTPQSVLMVTPLWARDGGVATHVQASAAALAERGVSVSVLAGRVESDHCPEGVSVHHGAALLNAGEPAASRLEGAPPGRPDVIHIHQLDDPSIVRALRTRAPVVISAHGYPACTSGLYYFRPGHECTRAHGAGCWPNLIARGCAHGFDPRPLPASFRRAGLAVQALRCADLAVAYSSSVERHLANNGIERRRVIPLFPTMTPQAGGGHAGRRRVVFAGRVVATKGLGVLIRAAREVQGEFIVCGDGWQLDAMRRLARRVGVDARVDFKGWLSAEALAAELANASVVALPSLWPEPFGLVGIEALSAGRPVVASATGGVAEWLQDGRSGLCVPPGDPRALARALNELLGDPERQRAMGAAGSEFVAAHFSAECHVAALLEAYASARASWQAAPAPAPV